MEKKYYDLIVSLIKGHKKYPGLEAILEDIVNDVYEHAKVVISSVANEDVVKTYLDKVVSTSIITVPKKMNLNTRIQHRSITSIPEPSEKTELSGLNEIAVEQEDILNALIDEPVQEIEVKADYTETTADTETKEATAEEVSSFVAAEEEINEPEINEILNEEPVTEPEIPQEENLIIETNELAIEEVDNSLVDRMINGIEPEEKESSTEEIIIDNDLADMAETDMEVELPVNSSETEEILYTEDCTEPLESFVEEDPLEFEPLAEAESSIEEEVSAQEDKEPEELLLAAEEDEEEEESGELDLPEETSDGLLTEDMTDETEESEELLSDEENESDIDFHPVSYECFSYEPIIEEFDGDEIESALKELDSKHPENKIIKICCMKYNQNMTVSQISEELGLEQEIVLEALNDIIDVVKD